MHYGVSVVYYYTEAHGLQISHGIGADILSLKYRPNTPNGLTQIRNDILHRHQAYVEVIIMNLIPLENDPKPKDSDDDWE